MHEVRVQIEGWLHPASRSISWQNAHLSHIRILQQNAVLMPGNAVLRPFDLPLREPRMNGPEASISNLWTDFSDWGSPTRAASCPVDRWSCNNPSAASRFGAVDGLREAALRPNVGFAWTSTYAERSFSGAIRATRRRRPWTSIRSARFHARPGRRKPDVQPRKMVKKTMRGRRNATAAGPISSSAPACWHKPTHPVQSDEALGLGPTLGSACVSGGDG